MGVKKDLKALSDSVTKAIASNEKRKKRLGPDVDKIKKDLETVKGLFHVVPVPQWSEITTKLGSISTQLEKLAQNEVNA